MSIKTDAARVVRILTNSGGSIIYTFGNGGSAAIANHMACDWMKGTKGLLKVLSLSSNGSLLSAIANDLGYSRTCSAQLRYLSDYTSIVVLISSSGNSSNIVEAAKFAKSECFHLIGFSGNAKKSKGGKLRQLSCLSVYCDSEDYGTIEDYHSQVMHEILRQLKKQSK